MPFHIERAGSTYIVKDDAGKVYGHHKSRKEAQAQVYVIQKNEKKG